VSGWAELGGDCLGTFYPDLGNQFAASSDYIMKTVINPGGRPRKDNPKVGDIAIWEGHFEFVVQVH
jgi:hypothetical protein